MKKDYFEHYEELPKSIQDLLDRFPQEQMSYFQMKRILKTFNENGYTFEYGIDGFPYNLRPLKKVHLSESSFKELVKNQNRINERLGL